MSKNNPLSHRDKNPIKDQMIKKYSKINDPQIDNVNLPYPGSPTNQLPKSSGFRTNRNSNVNENRMPQYRSGAQPDPSL